MKLSADSNAVIDNTWRSTFIERLATLITAKYFYI